jgi:hypothetical protein
MRVVRQCNSVWRSCHDLKNLAFWRPGIHPDPDYPEAPSLPGLFKKRTQLTPVLHSANATALAWHSTGDASKPADCKNARRSFEAPRAKLV